MNKVISINTNSSQRTKNESVCVIFGCFDPIHAGHLTMIRDASRYGRVVVFLCSDSYIRNKNGKLCATWAQREEWLRQISGISDVVSFDDRKGDFVAGIKMLAKKFPANAITLVSGNSEHSTEVKRIASQMGISVISGVGTEWQFKTTHVKTTKKKIDKVNVVCLKWGNKFGPEYVNRLHAGVIRNTRNTEIKFHCYTDSATGLDANIIVHPLPLNNVQSWWNKLFLFSNDIGIERGEKIIYMDLDTLITGNIDELLAVDPHKIVVLEDFYKGMAKSANDIGSGLMAWYHGDYEFLWLDFIADTEAAVKQMHPYGDQYWIQTKVKDRICWQHIFPRQVVSFKVHCRDGLSRNARVVCYHGKPSIPESITNYTVDWKWKIKPAQWVERYWRD